MNTELILQQFNENYAHLYEFGLQLDGVSELKRNQFVISVSVPFIFDHRRIPKEFNGLLVRSSIRGELPEEFKNLNPEKDYIWAYQRFESFVNNNESIIKKELGNLSLSRNEILDAICFGDFQQHKRKCIQWEDMGKIPSWTKRPT